jgi:hypothetical protein
MISENKIKMIEAVGPLFEKEIISEAVFLKYVERVLKGKY